FVQMVRRLTQVAWRSKKTTTCLVLGAAVKVSLFYELSLPRPWEPDSEFMLYENSLRELALADSLGFQAVRLTEHHFQEEKCHLSCPEVLLGALTQRTSRMRLGPEVAHKTPGI